MGKPRIESLRHQTGFETYVSLGDKRTIAEVARRIQASEQAVHGWSQAFGWQKRLHEREKIIAETVAKMAIEDEAKSRVLQINICRAVQARFAQSLQAGNQAVSTSDFVRAAQHELLLRGKATERSEVIVAGAFDKLIDALAAIIDREVPDLCPACKAELGIKGKLGAGLIEASNSASAAHA